MKTTLKLIIVFLTLIFTKANFSQNHNKPTNLFIRVYDFDGEKFAQGKIISVSDSLLQLKKNSRLISINPKDIGMIKTKRSIGNNMIIGSTIGGLAGVLTGVQIGKNENPYEIYGIIEEENTTFNAMFGLFAGAFT